jgi:hypothetical protein
MIPLDDAIHRAWPILMEAVRMRRTVSYSELASRAGPPLRARSIHRQLLNGLAARCRLAGLPNLAALVVRKDTGTPGIGWHDPTGIDGRDPSTRWAEAVLACYDHRWPRGPDALLGPRPKGRARPRATGGDGTDP